VGDPFGVPTKTYYLEVLKNQSVGPSGYVSQSKNKLALSQSRKYFKNAVSRIKVPRYDLPCISIGLGESSRFTNVQPDLFLMIVIYSSIGGSLFSQV
jgi:hypothetical protein